MASLTVHHNGSTASTALRGRVLIGRRPTNHVVIEHPSVSRVHAWVDTAGGDYRITDTGSRTGTFVNGRKISGQHPLREGDEIRIGPAYLRFRAASAEPEPARPAAAATPAREPVVKAVNGHARPNGRTAGTGDTLVVDDPSTGSGILFDCACGAPLWVSLAHAGRTGRCRYCGRTVTVPTVSRGTPPPEAVVFEPDAPTPSPGTPGEGRGEGLQSSSSQLWPQVQHPHPSPLPAYRERELDRSAQSIACAICQCDIDPVADQTTACPSCGLTFHADCWVENCGCAAFGCDQVNALATSEPTDATGGAGESVGDDLANPPFPWEYVLLGAGAVAALAGVLAFGVPSLLVLVAAGVFLARRPRDDGMTGGRRRKAVLLAAAVLALAGLAAGAVVSYLWWLV